MTYQFLKWRSVAVVLPLALLASCGTITRGKSESVTITSEPADAAISTSTGQYCPRSPCTITVERKKEFTAFAEKPGYDKGSIEIKTKVSGGGAAGMAGNVLIGGVIGIGVDAATGASLDHTPNPAHIILIRTGSPKPVASQPNKSPKRPTKQGKPAV